jgi:Ribbon-helix-helix protein, copG family
MKKTSLYLEDELDAALTRRAAAEGVSKAHLIRRELRAVADGARRPPLVGRGVIQGGPPDLAANDEHYLSELGFGQG